MKLRVARKQNGVAAVEFSLVFLFLFGLVAGIVEFGRALYEYDTLAKAARTGARYLAVYNANDPIVRANAINIALCGKVSCATTSPVLPGLTAAMISVAEPVATPALSGIQVAPYGTFDVVTVTIGGAPGGAASPYVFRSLFPGLFTVTFGPISVAMPQVFG